MLGRDRDAAQQLSAVRAVLHQPHNRDSWRNYIAVALWATVEQGQLDEFEGVLAELRRLRPTPRRVWPIMRTIWVFVAQGRLAQCMAAPDEEREARFAAAHAAIRDLRRAASTPFLRAHYLISAGTYQQLTGDNVGALRQLSQAERFARGQDAPVLEYEIARVRLAPCGRSATRPRPAGRRASR